MTLYLKYRSKNLDELDSADVRESLKKTVKSGKIPHAFLFAGPKGTGKTSAARILAKIINCENLKYGVPCDKCDQCLSITRGSNLDVIELDAASHRGIDDVRVLRDAVKLSPAKAKKKIYIIDEAHMLTTEASNALLKTLEEPPEHVIFILATTNPEKLIDTIRSRATYIPFKKAKAGEIVRSLKRVVSGEKIKIKDDALEIIAKMSEGSFRDAIKTLEQVTSERKDLSKESLEEYLFSRKAFDITKFTELLTDKKTKELITEIAKFESRGVAVENFLRALLGSLRGSLLAKVGVGEDEFPGVGKDDLLTLIELFNGALGDLAAAPIETLPLEVAVIKWCEGGTGDRSQTASLKKDSRLDEVEVGQDNRSASAESKDDSGSKVSPIIDDAQTVSSALSSQTTVPVGGEEIGVNDEIRPAERDPALQEKNIQPENVDDSVWKAILSLVKPLNASIEALLRAARPVGYDGKTLTLGVYYKFHKERLEDARHRIILEDVVAQVLKSPTRVTCTLVDPPPKKVVEEVKTEAVLTEGKDTDIIKVAEEIFGN